MKLQLIIITAGMVLLLCILYLFSEITESERDGINHQLTDSTIYVNLAETNLRGDVISNQSGSNILESISNNHSFPNGLNFTTNVTTESGDKVEIKPDVVPAPPSPMPTIAATVEVKTDAPTGIPPRWRKNQYLHSLGYLPYEVCRDRQRFEPISVEYTYSNENLTLYVSELSVFGTTDSSGKPTSVTGISVLIYNRLRDRPCESHWYGRMHCHVSKLLPEIKYEVGEIKGKTERLDPNSENRFAIVLYLPAPLALPLSDRFSLYLTVEGMEARVPICYVHVESTALVTACSPPLFNYPNKFFLGEPKYKTDLTTQWILYNILVLNFNVVINDEVDSLSPVLSQFKYEPKVAYRPNWLKLLHVGDTIDVHYILEIFSVASCYWYSRIRSRWAISSQSPDTFFFPSWPLNVMEQEFNRLPLDAFIEVPIVDIWSKKIDQPTDSVFERWNVILPVRTTLHSANVLINPRLFDLCMVHYRINPVIPSNWADPTGLSRGNIREIKASDTWYYYGLRVIHMYALARPDLNFARHQYIDYDHVDIRELKPDVDWTAVWQEIVRLNSTRTKQN
jgi:hypothetical protein